VRRDYEYIVVGLGALGSGAAYWLARRAGPDVLGLERFEVGHDRGASQDHSRIVRLSYHTPAYVALAKRAYETWAEVESAAGVGLITRTGGLDLWPGNAAIPQADYTGSLRAAEVPFEMLDAGDVMRRWPVWRLPADASAVFQEDGGFAAAARCNAVHRRLAIEHGATLRDRTPVASVRDLGQEIEVRIQAGDGETRALRCRRLILAVDSWTNELLAPLGASLPLTITEEQVTYFSARDAGAFAPDRFPIWIWMDDPCFYGFPAFGEAGPKVAQDVGGEEVTPQTRSFSPNARVSARIRGFLERHLPGALGPEILTKTCPYTLTPDRDLVVDAVPGHPGVLVTLGAAHGFKFASLIGKLLSDLAIDGATETDLGPFRMDRPLLTMDDPPTRFLT
jgi:sarcosine oxidase